MSARGPAPLAAFDPLAAAQPALATPLARVLAERIHRHGPLCFRDWMDACLYHPEHGYYRRGRPTVGRDGDFLTSPEVHPLFGAAIGYLAAALWAGLGRPAPFRIVEVGPGSGALAESLLRHLHAAAPNLAAAVEYTLVEPDPQSAARQRERLAPLTVPAALTSVADLSELEGGYQLVLANELLDALPVHLLRFADGGWRELYVEHSAAGGFQTGDGALSDARLIDPLTALKPSEGQLVEVGPARSAMTASLAGALGGHGLLLLFDYGYRRARLYAPWRRDGTLMTFRRHVPGDDPLAHPGEQDITAHIDIDQVEEAAREAGLAPLPTRSQAEWLHQLGAAVLPAVADAGGETGAYLAARRAAETLSDPAGLGRIAVMAFRRGELPALPGWELA